MHSMTNRVYRGHNKCCFFQGSALRPQLLVLQPKGIDQYIETSTDALSVRGFEEYLCSNYFLGKLTVDDYV